MEKGRIKATSVNSERKLGSEIDRGLLLTSFSNWIRSFGRLCLCLAGCGVTFTAKRVHTHVRESASPSADTFSSKYSSVV